MTCFEMLSIGIKSRKWIQQYPMIARKMLKNMAIRVSTRALRIKTLLIFTMGKTGYYTNLPCSGVVTRHVANCN